jgi:hypothetical protein
VSSSAATSRAIAGTVVPDADAMMIIARRTRTDSPCPAARSRRGQLGGRWLLSCACVGWWLLLRVSVMAGEGLRGGWSVSLVVYGKKKVYGSIP